jgi:hypothetical protein
MILQNRRDHRGESQSRGPTLSAIELFSRSRMNESSEIAEQTGRVNDVLAWYSAYRRCDRCLKTRRQTRVGTAALKNIKGQVGKRAWHSMSKCTFACATTSQHVGVVIWTQKSDSPVACLISSPCDVCSCMLSARVREREQRSPRTCHGDLRGYKEGR